MRLLDDPRVSFAVIWCGLLSMTFYALDGQLGIARLLAISTAVNIMIHLHQLRRRGQ